MQNHVQECLEEANIRMRIPETNLEEETLQAVMHREVRLKKISIAGKVSEQALM